MITRRSLLRAIQVGIGLSLGWHLATYCLL